MSMHVTTKMTDHSLHCFGHIIARVILLVGENMLKIIYCTPQDIDMWQPIVMSTPLGSGHTIFAFSIVRRLPSVITLGFRSFQGKVYIRSLPNLVWVFIGLIACMGLLLVKITL